MNKGIITNILGIALAVLIMLAGYAIPKKLLFDRERREADSKWAVSEIAGADASEEHPMPTPTALPSGETIMAGLSRETELWSVLSRRSHAAEFVPREPDENEHPMGVAVNLAMEELDMLFHMDGFPRIDVWNFSFDYAELIEPRSFDEPEEYSDRASFAVWNIILSEREFGSVINVTVDACDGTVYSLYFTSPTASDPGAPFEMLVSYASYLGLETHKPFEGSVNGASYSARFSGILLSADVFPSAAEFTFSLRAYAN